MRKNASRPDGDNPEWTAQEVRESRPLMDVLPAETVAGIRRARGPQKSPTKELISLRLDRDVLEAYRATGRGWQTRANEALRAHAKSRLVTRAQPHRRPKRRAS